MTERPGSVPVTVVIAARDEARNIRECVESVRWADEIIVAERGSTDDTALLAAKSGAVVMDAPAATIGAQRNIAIAAARNAWILVVDADERATPELESAVAMAVASGALFDGYRVPRRNFFLGREIRHGGWGRERDRPLRLFRNTLRYGDSRVHESVTVTGPVGTLGQPLLHFTYASLEQYFEKFVRYSAWWAEQSWERGRRASAADVVWRPPARFVTMYLLRGGWRDGAHGAVLAALAAASVLAKYARLWERSRKGDVRPGGSYSVRGEP